jgi:uncharacterized protein
MISHELALQYLNETIENKNIIKHMLAAEAFMRAAARELKVKSEKLKVEEEINEDEWGMVGLLHDGDYIPSVPPEKQGIAVVDMLKAIGYEISDNAAHAMAAHNWHNTGVEPESKMDWAIFCGDSLTGLIVASTLVLPSRKLADLTVENVLNRYKEKSFAKGTRREEIALCEEKLGLSLSEFVGITLKAMQGISNELGL